MNKEHYSSQSTNRVISTDLFRFSTSNVFPHSLELGAIEERSNGLDEGASFPCGAVAYLAWIAVASREGGFHGNPDC